MDTIEDNLAATIEDNPIIKKKKVAQKDSLREDYAEVAEGSKSAMVLN